MTIQPEAPETEGRSGLSRRTVMKAGAHAAWAIPAITVVTSAPAFAAQSGQPTCDPVPSGSGAWTGPSSTRAIPCTVSVANKGAADTVGLVLTASFPTGWDPTVGAPSNGWTVSKSVNVFTFTPPSQVGAGKTATFDVTFSPKASNKNRAVAITLNTNVQNGTAESGIIAVSAG